MYETAIIIPHYNDMERLGRCLNALAPQIRATVQIVVVDNDSSEDLTPIRQKWPDVMVISESKKGAGPARNAGVRETDSTWIMFLDCDCVPASDWVERGMEIASEHAVIGGPVKLFHETPPPKSGAEAFETVFAFQMQDYFEKHSFLGSGNLVTSRKVFDSVGGFGAGVSEDKDWSQRAAQKGFKLGFDNRLVVQHPSRSDWAALERKWVRLTSEAFKTDVESSLDKLSWFMKALVMPVSVLIHLPRILVSQKLNKREKLAALTTLTRLRVARSFWMLRELMSTK